jgi:propanol-preferring alcohol dehydrogenase
MKAMVLSEIYELRPDSKPLDLKDLPVPIPGPGEVLIKVHVCGVCHTELDEIEGRTPPASFPIILGHQAVGTVSKLGAGVEQYAVGDRVGIAWIYSACGNCKFCKSGKENLCSEFKATGRDANGGYGEYMVADTSFVYDIPEALSDIQTAPLLCAGAIGYRSLRLTGLEDGQILGLTGFGASAHLVLKMALYKFPNSKIMVFARSEKEQQFARNLGAYWAGNTTDRPPIPIDAIIDTTPAWLPIVQALASLKPGGRLVINAIRKEQMDQNELLNLDYGAHLWMEKEVKSVANITRRDVVEFLALAAEIPIKPQVEEYALADANKALIDMKFKPVKGAKVLILTE